MTYSLSRFQKETARSSYIGSLKESPARSTWLLNLLACVLAFFACVARTALGQQPAQPGGVGGQVSDPEAIQLLTNALNSMASKALLSSLLDVGIQGTTASPTGDVTGTFKAKVRGSDWSFETARGSTATSYRILNGAGTLRVNSDLKNLPPTVTQGYPLDVFPLFGRWTQFGVPGAVASVTGNVTIDNISCHQLHVKVPNPAPNSILLNHHGEMDVLVDSNTGLVTAIAFNASMDSRFNSTVRIENRFSDYQMMAGLLVPTQITHHVAGRARIVYRITTVTINNGFTDADFEN